MTAAALAARPLSLAAPCSIVQPAACGPALRPAVAHLLALLQQAAGQRGRVQAYSGHAPTLCVPPLHPTVALWNHSSCMMMH
jgi:hypothetical protein